MSAHLCLMAWNEPIGRPNWTRTLAYSTAISSTFWAPPTCSAARPTAARSSTVDSDAQPAPSVPSRRAGVSANSSLACLRVWSIVDSGGAGEPGGVAVDGEQAHAAAGAGRRPALAGAAAEARDPAVAEHKAAFDLYVRAGEAAGLKRLEAKALSAGSGPDSGYLVPDTIEREVLRRLCGDLADPRHRLGAHDLGRALQARLLDHRRLGRLGRRDRGAAADQCRDARRALLPGDGALRQPAATQTLLDDAVVDIEQWIATEVETAFAEQEGAAFVNGDGVNKPKGFLASDTVDNGAWAWGKLGFVPTGNCRRLPGA